MSDSTGTATETFDQRPAGALITAGTHVFALVVGLFAGFLGLLVSDQMGAVLLGLVAAAVVYGYVYYSNLSTTVAATPNALVIEMDAGGGDMEVPFEDIEIAIRGGYFADEQLGTGTYEVIRTGGENPTVRFIEDTDRFEELVADRVTEPRQQYRETDHRTRHFWYLWPEHLEEELPGEPVVEADELESTLDIDMGDVDLDGLDDAVGMDSIDDFGDVHAVEGSGDAGAFDDSGGGGGDGGGDIGGGGGGDI